MKYHIDWLNQQIEEGQSFKFLYFWGHQPSKDGSITKSCLSQWWEESFSVEGIEYRTAEHWMMAEKARLFEDYECLDHILAAHSPAEAKKWGRKVRNFDEVSWTTHRYEVVKQGNLHKFSQSEDLKYFLLQTNNRILVEASPHDKIWGIGLTVNSTGVSHPQNWRGLNLLGFALMEVRDLLTKE